MTVKKKASYYTSDLDSFAFVHYYFETQHNSNFHYKNYASYPNVIPAFCHRGKARISAVPDLHRKQYPAMFDTAEMSKRHPIHFEYDN